MVTRYWGTCWCPCTALFSSAYIIRRSLGHSYLAHLPNFTSRENQVWMDNAHLVIWVFAIISYSLNKCQGQPLGAMGLVPSTGCPAVWGTAGAGGISSPGPSHCQGVLSLNSSDGMTWDRQKSQGPELCKLLACWEQWPQSIFKVTFSQNFSEAKASGVFVESAWGGGPGRGRMAYSPY